MVYTYQKLLENIGYKKLDEKYDSTYDGFLEYIKTVDTSYFLSEKDLKNFKEIVLLDDDTYNTLKSHLKDYNKNEELVITSYFLKYLLFYFEDPSLNDIFQVPKCKLYKNCIFELFVLMSIVEERVKALKNRNMGEDVLRPRLFRINMMTKHHTNKDFHNFRWSSFDYYINLFDIDDLSFMIPYIFDANIHIFENKDKVKAVLAGGGDRIRKDGQINGVNKIFDFAFTTKYKETKDEYIGYYINPNGFYTNKLMHLNKNEWKEIIKEGDYILEMHVGGNYKYEDNIKAFKKAVEFAKKYFSDYDFKAIYGYSWLFSPQIPSIIEKESSNILKMFKTGYIVPCSSGDSLAFSFIYEKEKMDVKDMPTSTSLERSIKSYYEKGGKINCGLYFLTLDDLDKIEENVYQNHVLN